jgi:HEPN domain-containing protein
MSDRDEARALLAVARRDAAAVSAMMDAAAFADEVFGFHAQQAVEKTLKAWLCDLHVEFPRTHNLSILLALLQQAGAPVAPFEALDWLNAFAVQYRYEAYDDLGTPLDRMAVRDSVLVLLNHVSMILG